MSFLAGLHTIGNASYSPLGAVLWLGLLAALFGVWHVTYHRREATDQKAIERSLAWPETQGKVTATRWMGNYVEVFYEYSVAIGTLSGKYQENLPMTITDTPHKSYSRASHSKDEANRILADYPIGQEVVIRYDPEAPSESVMFCRGAVSSATQKS
jgi:Protein of unknown function (DUF3592)